jgi:hypothetical protein
MGETFNASLNRAKDAASQLLAAGLQPLLEALTPILQRTAEWLNQLRETNPEVVKLGGGMLAAVAAGAPLLLVLGQVLDTMQKIKSLGIGGALGKAGLFGLAAAGGVGLGVAGAKAIGKATGNEELANITLSKAVSDITTFFKRSIFLIVAGLSEV